MPMTSSFWIKIAGLGKREWSSCVEGTKMVNVFFFRFNTQRTTAILATQKANVSPFLQKKISNCLILIQTIDPSSSVLSILVLKDILHIYIIQGKWFKKPLVTSIGWMEAILLCFEDTQHSWSYMSSRKLRVKQYDHHRTRGSFFNCTKWNKKKYQPLSVRIGGCSCGGRCGLQDSRRDVSSIWICVSFPAGPE